MNLAPALQTRGLRSVAIRISGTAVSEGRRELRRRERYLRALSRASRISRVRDRQSDRSRHLGRRDRARSASDRETTSRGLNGKTLGPVLASMATLDSGRVTAARASPPASRAHGGAAFTGYDANM